MSESNLRAEKNDYGWSVIDPDGGRWWPGPSVGLGQSADPASEVVRICESEPSLGVWRDYA